MAVATTAFLIRVVGDHLLASTVAYYVEDWIWSLTNLPRHIEDKERATVHMDNAVSRPCAGAGDKGSGWQYCHFTIRRDLVAVGHLPPMWAKPGRRDPARSMPLPGLRVASRPRCRADQFISG